MADTAAQAPQDRMPGAFTPGAFVWHELLTRDLAKATEFYGKLFGWTFEKTPMPEMDYYLAKLDGRHVGGVYECAVMEIPSHWLGYVSVPDVDAAVVAATKAGGKVVQGPADIPHVGRFAIIIDPQGGAFAAFRDNVGDAKTGDEPNGVFTWDQLNTSDPAGSTAFYAAVVGWKHEGFAGMDGASVFKSGDLMEASMLQAPEGTPTHWLSHIRVGNLDEARRQASELGATIHLAEIVIPEVGRLSVIEDPAGAVVALFELQEG